MAAVEAFACRLDADQLDAAILYERVECTNRVGSAADAGDYRFRQTSHALEHLRTRLASNHRLEVPHHSRVRRGADHGADDVIRVIDVGDPVANGLGRRVLERSRTARNADHRGAHQSHAEDVELLPPNVFLAHVYDAL